MLTIFFLAVVMAYAHDGPLKEWCEIQGNRRVCEAPKAWWGKYDLCYELDGNRQCQVYYVPLASPYKAYCDSAVTDHRNAVTSALFERSAKYVSSMSECTLDPSHWAQDPRNLCTWRDNWIENECYAEIGSWMEENGVGGVQAQFLMSEPQVLNNAVNLQWTFGVPATAIIEYSTSETGPWETTIVSDAVKPIHQYPLEGLSPGTTYHFHITGKNEAGDVIHSGAQSFQTLN